MLNGIREKSNLHSHAKGINRVILFKLIRSNIFHFPELLSGLWVKRKQFYGNCVNISLTVKHTRICKSIKTTPW